MDSDTNTGTCLRPSCTAIVCPTISGKIVEVRDHVLIMRFERVAFISSTRRMRRSSMNGPFLELRDIPYDLPFPRLRPRTMSRELAFLGSRVRRPSVILPHGVTGWRAPLALPSPPPCGWSTGFMAVPRPDGRLPCQRERPALPPDSLACVTFESCP